MTAMVLLAFCGLLLLSILFKFSIVYALLGGYFLFFGFGLHRKKSPKQLWKASLAGLRTMRDLILVYVLIGMLTACWRASGTIPAIVNYAFGLLDPRFVVLLTFILCSILSTLTGTAFGTCATMGVICMSIARAMGIDPLFTAGAALSGAYFGDRCSPVSTGALLVSELTETELYKNVGLMLKSAVPAYVLSCLVYFLLGLGGAEVSGTSSAAAVFQRNFQLGFIPVIPPLLILFFALFRANIYVVMGVSVLSAMGVFFFYQKGDVLQLFLWMWKGYEAADPELAVMLNGGGVVSMISPILIVILSGTYRGLFQETRILDGVKGFINRLAGKISVYGAAILTGLATVGMSCNQGLGMIFTEELMKEQVQDPYERMLVVENTVVVLAPLIPWSVSFSASAGPLGVPFTAVFFAVFLYLLPLSGLVRELWKKSRKKAKKA